MIDIYKKTIRNERLESLDEIQKGSWVLAVDPSDEEIDFLSKKAGLERGHILDALDQFESPRFEMEPSGLYVFLRFPFVDDDEIHTIPVLFVLADDFVACVVRDSKKLFDDFLSEKIEFYTTQKSKLLLFIFLKISLLYRNYLNNINKRVRSRESNVSRISSADIVDFVSLERVLNDFITALVPASNIYKSLLSKQYLKYFKEDQDLVEDLLLANDEAVDICKTNIKMIVNIREAHSTVMTNNLNRAIKFLTAITIILTLPTMIASVYGMNVMLPFQNHPYAFMGIMAMTVLVVVVAFWVFYKKNWL